MDMAKRCNVTLLVPMSAYNYTWASHHIERAQMYTTCTQ